MENSTVGRRTRRASESDLEVFELSQGRYCLSQAASDRSTLRVAPFDAIELDPSLLWGERYPKTETAK